MKGEGLATLCSRFLPASEDTRPFFILQPHPTPHFLCVSGNDSGIAGVWRDLGSGSSPHPPTQTRTPTISPELTLGPELRLCLPTPPFSTKIWTPWLARGHTETWSAGAGLPTGPRVEKPKLSRAGPLWPGPSPLTHPLSPGPLPRCGFCQVHLDTSLAATLGEHPQPRGPDRWGWG